MEAGMKKYMLVVLLALAFLLTGLQVVPSPADAAEDRGNAAPFETLPDDLQGVDVKDYYIDSAARPAGFLRTVIGHVVVLHEDTGQAFFAAAGDAVFKHDAIFTLENARCRIKFTSDDIITMGEDARIGISEYIDDRVRKKKTSIFSMLRGKAMFYALRLFKYRNVSSTVKTPTAVIGVRGTKFGVEVVEIDTKIAQSSPIYLADASGSGAQYLARDGNKKTKTKIHCFRGGLDVTSEGISQPLDEGKTWEDNKVGDTSPEDKQDFEDATRTPDPDADKDEGSGDEGGAIDAPAPPDPAPPTPDPDPPVPPTPPKPESTLQGYFSGMIRDLEYMPGLDDVYVSSSRQGFDSGVVATADGLSQAGFIEGVADVGFDNPHLKRVRVNAGSVSADNLGLPVTVSDPPLGFNQYMEWGWWYVADSFIIVASDPPPPESIPHDLRHKGYYVFGVPTPDAAVTGIEGYYTGPAYGTYYDAADSGAPQGTDMSGSFNCYVNGPDGTIDSFSMTVTGGGGTIATINAATGTMNGSQFEISGGTWNLNGTIDPPSAPDPLYKSCHGSLYGPSGNHIGGAWGMKEPGVAGAQGVFQGSPGY